MVRQRAAYRRFRLPRLCTERTSLRDVCKTRGKMNRRGAAQRLVVSTSGSGVLTNAGTTKAAGSRSVRLLCYFILHLRVGRRGCSCLWWLCDSKECRAHAPGEYDNEQQGDKKLQKKHPAIPLFLARKHIMPLRATAVHVHTLNLYVHAASFL